jgi:branched-chain amino acid transport system ATP-binding protein
MPTLNVQDLESGYGEVQILWGADLTLEDGQLTSLVGTNGAGKTTLLRTIMGTISPWQGSIQLDGKEIGGVPPYHKADLGLVLVPEGRQLFTNMSVLENLELGATNSRARTRMEHNYERVFELFPRLAERRNQIAGTLSGGEQQMLAVARGLMAEPQILMFDELSLGLAPVLVLDIFSTLERLKEAGLTMLLVEQNVHMALSVSDYTYVMSEGRITLQGEPEELAQNSDVQSAYLGL